jgi:hypothetical protein
MRRIVLLVVPLMLALSVVARADGPPSISAVIPDYPNGTLFIAGSNFGTSPRVEIGGIGVTVISSSDALLLAQLPAMTVAYPGTYLVRVSTRGKGRGDSDGESATFVVAIGTAGPKGDKGATGFMGAQGPPGTIAAFMCPQFQYLIGIDQSGAPTCRPLQAQPPSTGGAPVLDQVFVPGLSSSVNVNASTQFAQTFTVGISGRMTGVDLSVVTGDPPGTEAALISILRTTPGGLPDAAQTTIEEVTLPASYWSLRGTPNEQAYRHIDLAPFSVTAGDVLAISVTTNGGGLSWQGGGDGRVPYPAGRVTYPPGNPFVLSPGGWTEMPGFDFAFQTYVIPAS